MKNSTVNYSEPAAPTEPMALRESADPVFPDWSAMTPVSYRPPVEAAFEKCEQWLQAYPNRRQLFRKRARARCLVEFVL